MGRQGLTADEPVVFPADFPLADIRGRFPALGIEDNGRPRIYLDNPAGTQVPEQVISALRNCLVDANANLGGMFETSRRADALVADAHAAMADFLNAASPAEIIFGQNMTTLTLHVSRSLGRTFAAGDEIIVTRMDHDANIAPWLLLAEDLDISIRWLDFDVDSCEFDLADLERLLGTRTRLVCIGGASNLTGTINDVAAVSRLARDAGALTYVDAVQLAPHLAIDVAELGCDFLACSAYKFFGPHQGVLWGREESLASLTPYKARPAPDALPAAFETGTQSHEGMAGTAAAVDYFAWIGDSHAVGYHARNEQYSGRRRSVRAALQYLFDYESALAAKLIDGLKAIPGVRIHGITDPAALGRRVPTVAFSVDGMQPSDIARALGERNIFVWSGHNYALELVRALGLDGSGGVVRIGPVHYNGADEIDTVLNELESIVSGPAT